MARIELSETDTGMAVDVRAGDEVALELDETPTSGHRWAVVELAGPLEGPILDEFRPGGGGIGASAGGCSSSARVRPVRAASSSFAGRSGSRSSRPDSSRPRSGSGSSAE